MALAKRGSRKIVVGETTYRWWLKGKTRFLGNAFGVCRLTIQPEAGGTTVSLWFYDDRYGGEADMDLGEISHNAITPKDVAEIIPLVFCEEGSPEILTRSFGLEGHYKVSEVFAASPAGWVGKFPVLSR